MSPKFMLPEIAQKKPGYHHGSPAVFGLKTRGFASPDHSGFAFIL
jgi:hypothetical protein